MIFSRVNIYYLLCNIDLPMLSLQIFTFAHNIPPKTIFLKIMLEKNSHNQIKHIEQDLRKQLRMYASRLQQMHPIVLRLWLTTILHLVHEGKLKPQQHYYWVRPENQSKDFQYDLLLPRLPLYKALSGFSRHFSKPEQQALFEVALCRTYDLPTAKRGRQKLSARVAGKTVPKAFIGYRIAHHQIDYMLAKVFSHPVAYRFKPTNGQIELPIYPAK